MHLVPVFKFIRVRQYLFSVYMCYNDGYGKHIADPRLGPTSTETRVSFFCNTKYM